MQNFLIVSSKNARRAESTLMHLGEIGCSRNLSSIEGEKARLSKAKDNLCRLMRARTIGLFLG